MAFIKPDPHELYGLRPEGDELLGNEDKLAVTQRIAERILAGVAAPPRSLDSPELQLVNAEVEKPDYPSGADPQDIQAIVREDDPADESAAEAEPEPEEPEEPEAFVEELPLENFQLRPGHGGEPI